MAKVRVYELAKELNMESKQLVEKLMAGGMNVKNYMSTLDEEAVLRAKEIASGVVSEVIEEKRIKPTVIRRRKKIKVKKEIPAAEVEEEAKEDVAEAARLRPPKKAEKKAKTEEEAIGKGVQEEELSAEEKAPEAEAPAEKVETAIPTEKISEALLKARAKPKRAKKKKVDEPAKIIKSPAEGPLRDVLKRTFEKKAMEPPAQKPDLPIRPIKPLEPLEIVTEVSERAERVKPAKRKKGKAKDEIQETQPRGIFRRRKKEIYERADLYQERSARPKIKRGAKKAKAEVKKGKQTEITVPKAIKRRIKVQEFVTVAELAKAMGTKASELIKCLMSQGYTASINQPIDFETASVVADDFGFELELDSFKEVDLIAQKEDRPEDLQPRPPVVTIMGHVDHGKTLLLDYIRKSNIIGGESGGITQHIGAYYVRTEGGDIVFLDTPGHEAFTAMRARGAKVTDIIILVVAADDGVMPQTKEAINHARAANIPIVVAINKIDKPAADPEKVKKDLAAVGIAAEDWGGETIVGNISAKTGEGVDDLLSLILLQAEVLELKANPNKPASGSVIEAKLDKSKGSVATVLIKNGKLRPGDYFVCGEHYGRVRAMLNHRGKKMVSAGPSIPVEIYGISSVPMAGDEFIVVQDERTAKQVAEYRRKRAKKQGIARRDIVSLDDLFERIKKGDVKELNIILKADVQGSLEALADLLVKQSTELVKLEIIHGATGGITESDVMLASASGAIIIGFNVRANPRVSELAEREKVDVRYYDIIYNAVKDIRLAMTGLLEPVFEEHIIGRAYIKEIFHVPKVGAVAGCQVSDGYVERNASVRLLRDDVVVFDGKISSLRRFKDDVKEVQSGYECGIGLENYDDIKPGDIFEVYHMEEVEAEL